MLYDIIGWVGAILIDASKPRKDIFSDIQSHL